MNLNLRPLINNFHKRASTLNQCIYNFSFFQIKVHSRENIEKLLEDVPSDCLPKELGGTLDATLEELNSKSMFIQ